MTFSADFRWVARLWWTTTKRRWRSESGAPLLVALFGGGLFFASARTPTGGEPLYLSAVLAVGGAALILVPLLMPGPSVLASRRFDLLPLSTPALTVLRIGFSNPIRTLLTGILLVWVALLPITRALFLQGRLPELLQLVAWVALALLIAQTVEDLLRYRRSIMVHQVVIFLGIATWPMTAEYLGDATNFVPGPAWTRGPLGAILVGSDRGFGAELGVGLAITGAAAVMLMLDAFLVRRAAGAPPPPPAAVRLSGGFARLLGRLGGPFSRALAKEITIPLRFLFLRATLVFTAGFAAASFLWGIPLLLLTVAFWWQPLGSNLVGPDLPRGGILRYHLAAWPLRRLFVLRHLAMILLSAVAVGGVALAMAIGGWVRAPVAGPATLWAYPVVFAYATTLVLLWAPAGDRFSLRYPDPLEMRVLMPPRKRSAGAGAMVSMLLGWGITALMAVGIWILAYLATGPIGDGAPGARRLAAAFTLAAAAHLLLYGLHIRMHDPRY